MAFGTDSEALIDGLEGFIFCDGECGIEIFDVEFFHLDACFEGGLWAGFAFGIEAVVESLCRWVDCIRG